MAYTKKREIFRQLLDRALSSKEILNVIEDVEITKTWLTEAILSKDEQIWEAGAKEITEVNELEKAFTLQFEKMQKLLKPLWLYRMYNAFSSSRSLDHQTDFPSLQKFQEYVGIVEFVSSISSFRAFIKGSFRFLIFGSIFLLLYAIAHSFFLWIPFLDTQGVFWVCAILLLLFCLLGITFTAIGIELRSVEWYKRKRIALGIDASATKLEEGQKAIEQAILDNGIVPELRVLLNAHLHSKYDTVLKKVSAPGLAEVFDPEYEIPTASKNKLLRLLETMPGGSIGIAGPRGAGKTTLLCSLCASSTLTIRGDPVLSVIVSAPVEYNARDFTLHIFSAICSRLLKLRGATLQTPWISMSDMHDDSNDSVFKSHALGLIGLKGLLTSAYIALVLGTLFIIFSLAIASLPLVSTVPSTTSTNKVPYTPTVSTKNVTPTPATTNPALPIQMPAIPNIDILQMYLSALNITPATLFSWGLVLLIPASLSLFAGLNSQGNLQNLQKEEQEKRQQRKRKIEERRRKEQGTDPVVAEAQKWLHKIRFQQSYSSGWSGTLSLPIALSATANTAISLAQNQLSVPEIIEGYRDFLRLLTREYKIILCIDEMDKLESDEQAHRFLNELKALFGLEHCFYLVSVSENAMSSFERRGLPFRDTFDSSFDCILSVDYLALESAQRLLRRRVIGIPEPFLCLCYCLSGGLARDLIRVCRELLERVEMVPQENSMSALCAYLITSDMQAKVTAVLIAARRSLAEAEMHAFFDAIQQIEMSLETSSLTLVHITRFLEEIKQSPTFQTEGENGDDTSRHTKELGMELGAYLYYAVTLLEYFTSKVDEKSWKDTNNSHDYTQLAKIRQLFSVSHRLVYTKTTHFRKVHAMLVLDL